MAKIGLIEVVWSRDLPSESSSVTVIKDATDRYFASFVVEVEPVQLSCNGRSIGIDLGIIDFATFDTGENDSFGRSSCVQYGQKPEVIPCYF